MRSCPDDSGRASQVLNIFGTGPALIRAISGRYINLSRGATNRGSSQVRPAYIAAEGVCAGATGCTRTIKRPSNVSCEASREYGRRALLNRESASS